MEPLEQMIEFLQKEWGDSLISVVLFGSHARGNPRQESDIDLQIIRKDFPRGRLERRKGWLQLEKKMPLPEDWKEKIAPILLTPEEAVQTRPYYLGILTAHRILFDRNQFYENILQRLKKRLEKLGSRLEIDEYGDEIWILKPGSKPGEAIRL